MKTQQRSAWIAIVLQIPLLLLLYFALRGTAGSRLPLLVLLFLLECAVIHFTHARMLADISVLQGVNAVQAAEIRERQRANLVQKCLFDIAAAANTASTMEEFYVAVHRALGIVLHAENFYIALFDSQHDQLIFPYAVDRNGDPYPPRPLKKGLTEYVLLSGQPALLDRAAILSMAERKEIVLIGTICEWWLGVPLRMNDRPVGVVAVQSYSTDTPYLESDKELLQTLAQHISAALARRQAEDSSRRNMKLVTQAKMEWESTVDSLPQFVCLIDEEGRVQRSNRTVEKWNLAHVGEIKGRTLHEVFHPICLPEFGPCFFEREWPDILQRLRLGAEVQQEIHDLQLHRSFRLQAHSILFYGEARQPYGVRRGAVVTIDDITTTKETERLLQQSNEELEVRVKERTSQWQEVIHQLEREIAERKRVEEALRDSNAKLKELDDLKTEFISTASHELRTPLTSVLGFSKIIRKKLLETIFPAVVSDDRKVEKARTQVSDNLTVIISESIRLTRLINDLLDIAKMEAGKLEWEMLPLHLGDVIYGAVQSMSAQFEEKGLPLEVQIAAPLPAIIGDRDRLHQVLLNLLSNALKFTHQGRVTVAAAAYGNAVTVRVSDTGIGISATDQERIFDKFKQVGNMLTEKPVGTGLGLAICRQIIEHHGGLIGVESRVNEGSTFHFTIPAQSEAAAEVECEHVREEELLGRLDYLARKHRQNSLLQRRRILIADDNDYVRDFLHFILEENGYDVAEADSGSEALRKAGAVPPDLLLLDIVLSDMDGHDVAQALRGQRNTASIPIIVFSSSDEPDWIEALDIEYFMPKPVDHERLLREISRLIAPPSVFKRILLVVAEEDRRKKVADLLNLYGYEVWTVENGEKCLQRLDVLHPNITIIDEELPEHPELIRYLVKHEEYGRTLSHLLLKR